MSAEQTERRGASRLGSGTWPTLKHAGVAPAIRALPGQLVGRAFFSCIDTEYYLRGWPLDAAILLDAAKPGATPAAIPGLTPVKGEHAYFNGPGDFKGELIATRYGNAWLIVAGGSGLAQRVHVLRASHAHDQPVTARIFAPVARQRATRPI